MGLIVQYLLAIACVLFVVSLPLSRLPIGGHLRRGAAALFLLAITPSVFVGAIRRASSGHSSPQPPFGATLGCLSVIVIVCIVSYAILEVRAYLRRPKSDAWSEYINLRSTGKTVLSQRDRDRMLPHLAPTDAREDET